MDQRIIAHCMGFDVTLTLQHFADEEPIITRYRRSHLSYECMTPTNVYFAGEEFSPSPNHKWDSPASVFELLFWITLSPDSGADIFTSYTPDQMEWANSYQCEEFSATFGEEEILRMFSEGEYELNYDSRGMVYTLEYEEEYGDITPVEIAIRYA